MAFPAAENELSLLDTIPEVEGGIFKDSRRLESLPRSDPGRPTLLSSLAALRYQRRQFLGLKSDIDMAITHLTEAVLLSSTQAHGIVVKLFLLATVLHSRFTYYRQPDDIKSSIKYLRFLRINFHSLETFDIPHPMGDLSSNLSRALAAGLKVTPGEALQISEELVAILPELVTPIILTKHRKVAIEVFSHSVGEMFRREDTRPIADQAIQMLREATALNPSLEVAFALAMSLIYRFETMFVMKDCDEALTNCDRVLATLHPGKNLTPMERKVMGLIAGLLVTRVNLSPTPENLEDAIHRLRILVQYSLDDENHTQFIRVLHWLRNIRFKYFGLTGNSGGTPPNPTVGDLRSELVLRAPGKSGLPIEMIKSPLNKFVTAVHIGETKDVEAAVEGSRKLMSLEPSSDLYSHSPYLDDSALFAGILMKAYQRTEKLDYLNEAITTCQNLHKISATSKLYRFEVGSRLHVSLRIRFQLLYRPQDFEELMQLSSELANEVSGEVFTRFQISCVWATAAQVRKHPSVSIAYEMAMSLLQETLIFCPTLQTQHHRLADVSKEGRFSSDYASYLIENGQVEQAIETLERGRALIWSEMRGLRTSTDQLRAVDLALAERFAHINQRLESVTMAVAQDDDEIGRIETGTGRREHSIGHLVLTQRTLLEERNSLISHIQSLPGFQYFLKSPSFDFLNAAASHGPVIIVNQSQACFSSHIILLLKDSRPFIISTPSGFHDRANRLQNELLHVRKEKGLDSKDYGRTLASVLLGLDELVGKPVIERLRELQVPEKSRVWWCPTGAFCSLPLHAMGPIPSDGGKDLYFSDLYIPSYTLTLAALIESRKPRSSSDASDNSKPSILLVAQPDALPGAFGEIKAIEAAKTPVKTLISAMATPETVIEGLRDHRFAHFVCHGLLEADKPFDASLELHNANLTLLAIVRSQLPAAEFAFLAACHTAELTEGSVADEGLHLAAAMQYCGFRSVVGTMWAMADTDGEDLSKHFYKAIFADKADQNGVRHVSYHKRSARALQIAVKKLRKKRGMTLERWVNFVHYGA